MSRTVPAAVPRRGRRRPSRSASPSPRPRPAAPRPRALLGFVALPVLALLALLVFELANWDKITPGVSALGTAIGGLTPTAAAARLEPSVQHLLDQPLELRGGGQSWRTSPRALGMQLAPDDLAVAAYQVGRQGNPLARLGDQLGAVIGGRVVTPASTTDQRALDASLQAMAKQIERPARDAQVSLGSDGSVQSSGAADGLQVDIPASRAQVSTALGTPVGVVELVTQAVPPAVTDDQIQAARDQLSGLLGPGAEPVYVTYGDQHWQLGQADLLKMVGVQGSQHPGEAASLKIDDAALRAWAAKLAKDVDQSVQDARFHFEGGRLQVLRPSRQGRTLDQAALVQSLHAALLGGQRSLELPVSVVEPAVSSEDPSALGITELIERGSTSFAGSIPEKKHNIQLAAERLNGIVVAPGQTFSFNDAVGPTTIDAGFQWGFAIQSGNNGPKTVPSVAGGICQVATTLFQPVFWAGYQLEERYWHLYWIPAYTSRGVVGLDVTVDGDAGLDFKWTNTTKEYILIQSASDDANVYFALYGKKPDWKVNVDDAKITNRTPPDTKPLAEEEPTLPWGRTLTVETARDGFDAEIVRHVVPNDGGKPRELDLKSTYQPAHTVTLVGTGGKPAGADVAAALQRVLDAQKPAEAKPSPSPTAEAAATAKPTASAGPAATPGAAAAQPTSAPPASQPTPAPKPAATSAPPAPTPKPPAAQAAPSSSAALAQRGIAPTPTPAH